MGRRKTHQEKGKTIKVKGQKKVEKVIGKKKSSTSSFKSLIVNGKAFHEKEERLVPIENEG